MVLHSVFTAYNNLLHHYLVNIFGFQRSITFRDFAVYDIISSAV